MADNHKTDDDWRRELTPEQYRITRRKGTEPAFTGAELQPGPGLGLYVFGRLADGFSISDAQAELNTVGDQMAAAFPQAHTCNSPSSEPSKGEESACVSTALARTHSSTSAGSSVAKQRP